MKKQKKNVIIAFSILLTACQTGEYGSDQIRSNNMDGVSQIDLHDDSKRRKSESRKNIMFAEDSRLLKQIIKLPNADIQSIVIYLGNVRELDGDKTIDGIKRLDRSYKIETYKYSEALNFLGNIHAGNKEIVHEKVDGDFVVEIRDKHGRTIDLLIPEHSLSQNYRLVKISGLTNTETLIWLNSKEINQWLSFLSINH